MSNPVRRPSPRTLDAGRSPPFATTKVDGADNVYVFRYGNAQSMFVVTSAGVIATDPIGYGRPQAVVTYVDEIKKVSSQPIKYVIYSHHHFDHIAGGKPFKDAGATFVAHKRARERLVALRDPHTVLPDETVDGARTITLGDTTLELTYIGLNHSDSSLVMRLPKQKVLFAVDFIPVGSVPGRGMIDSYPIEWEDSMKKVLAMDWDKLIPGAEPPHVPSGRVGRGEGRGPGRQVLGPGREGAEAALSTRAGPDTRPRCRSSCDAIVGSGAAHLSRATRWPCSSGRPPRGWRTRRRVCPSCTGSAPRG